MRTLCFALMAALLLGLTACSKKNTGEDTSQYKTLIVGMWEETEEGILPAGAIAEVAADGTVIVTLDDERKTKLTGTFNLEGDTLTVDVTGPDGEKNPHTLKILSLNEEKMVAEEENENGTKEEHTFTKKS